MIKRFIVAIVLLTLVCGGIVGFNMFRAQMIANFFANMPQQTVTVSTTQVEPVRWEPGISAVGTVIARQGVDVPSRSSGVIEEIGFTANQKVEAGAVLVRIERRVEEADLIAANAAVERDRQQLLRVRELQERGVNSAATLQEAQAQLDTSRSQLERLEANLEQKDIVAPFTGTIGIPRVDIGEYITPGTVIATLQDLDRMKVDFTVPEQQLQNLSIGQPVLFGLTAEAYPYQGQITGIDPKIDPASRLVSVQAEVGNSDGFLRPGQFINVRVQLPAENDVIALPQTAVVSSLYGSYVYVIEQAEEKAEAVPATESGTAQAQEAPEQGAAPAAGDAPKLVARQVFVEVGRRNATQIEVISGLKAGAQVVTAGQNRLSGGAPVTIDNTIDPTRPRANGAAVAGGAS